MTGVITQSSDCGDGVYIGETPPPHFKPMTDTELTLDQLTAIAGGVQMGTDDSTCTDRHIWNSLKDIYVFGNGANDVILKSNASSLRSDNRF